MWLDGRDTSISFETINTFPQCSNCEVQLICCKPLVCVHTLLLRLFESRGAWGGGGGGRGEGGGGITREL